jgi:uncharacterized membrane protein (UPF0127 family)
VDRLARLPVRRAHGLLVHDATTVRARLLGLAGLRSLAPGHALWLPRTRSVHTFGMRFALDLVWLDGVGNVVRIDRAVPPGRVRSCRAARSVLEVAATAAG